MNRTLSNNNLTIEQFAAFLDGNLSDDDMQMVSATIDGSPEYAAILSDVMSVDDSIEVMSGYDNILPDELQGMDFDLPIIPEMSDSSALVELTSIENPESDTVEILNDNVNITMASDKIEDIVIDSCHGEALAESPSIDEPFDMDQQPEDSNDFFDLA